VRIDPDQSPMATIPPRQLCAWAPPYCLRQLVGAVNPNRTGSPWIASAGYMDQADLMRLGSLERAYSFRRRLQDHVAAFLLEIVSGLWRQLNVSLVTGAYDDNVAALFEYEFGVVSQFEF
jgi:hypothetical protein